MNGCIYRNKFDVCMKYTTDKATSFRVGRNCLDRKPSNSDRIRAMTDEELAKFLYEFGDCPCFGVKFCERGTSCEDAVLMKLREPADNGACLAKETSEKVQE